MPLPRKLTFNAEMVEGVRYQVAQLQESKWRKDGVWGALSSNVEEWSRVASWLGCWAAGLEDLGDARVSVKCGTPAQPPSRHRRSASSPCRAASPWPRAGQGADCGGVWCGVGGHRTGVVGVGRRCLAVSQSEMVNGGMSV